jgi:hypothetical protein
MTTQERLLYQQIHPIKIMADIATAVIAITLMWNQLWLPAMLVVLILPNAASMLVVSLFNLEPQKKSALGDYVKQYITFAVDMARSAGLGVMIVGAWLHMPLVIVAGLLITLGAWMNGVLFPER